MNLNRERDLRAREIGREAGGLTWQELAIKGDAIPTKVAEERYYDETTDLWIPRGVLLFRPQRKKDSGRDVMVVL